MKMTNQEMQEREYLRMSQELKLSTIRTLQDLLYKETDWSTNQTSNRIGLSEDEQKVVKSKLIEQVKSL